MALPEQRDTGDEGRSEIGAQAHSVGTGDRARLERPSLFDDPLDVRIDQPGSSGDSPDLMDRLLVFEASPPRAYLAALLIGSLLVLMAAVLGFFPWEGAALGVIGLLATMFRGGSWVTLVCGVLVLVVAVVSLWPREPTLAEVERAGDTARSGQSTSEDVVPEGSLGFRLEELPDLWNGLDEPPTIDRGFSRSSERGRLDGFVMRFDEGASLSGAYDPTDDYVYALWASSRLDHQSVSTMYLHLCFLLHPYSQECIDAYWDDGMDGGIPEDYLGTRYSAEWRIGEETWRLAIVGNVQEIKVLGDPPD